jgi:endonuclease/exonuclease/phosphatase (EEP) superfamily protein YafD
MGPSGRPLRVLTFNVLSSNEQPLAVIEHVLGADADIVCLLEVNQSWHEFLEALRVKYPHRVEDLTAGDFSIACYTRLPVKSSEIRRFTPWGLPSVLFNLDDFGRPLTFVGTHPLPPTSSEDTDVWLGHLSEIAALAAGLEGEVIVAGDFNATPWCEGMRQLRAKSGLDFRCVDPVWPPTWGLNLPMMIPIDHVLVKGGLTVRKRVIGPEMGSDHRSVMVEIVR